MRCPCGRLIPISRIYCDECDQEIDAFFKSMDIEEADFEDFCSSHYTGNEQDAEY